MSKAVSVVRTPLFLSMLLVTSLVALAPSGNAAANGCVDAGSGITACGAAVAVGCGVSTGAGAATGIVAWTLVSSTESGSKSFSLRAPAFAGAADAPCTTASCTTGFLYANGVLVSESQTVC
jgi:hypothetical protein